VILADDYPPMLSATKRLLAVDCDVVAVVGDGAEIVDVASTLQPDVVVVDFNMPRVNGLEACRRIRRANPEIKVIVFTAMGDEGLKEQARRVGASALVSKHASGQELINAIKTACADSAV